MSVNTSVSGLMVEWPTTCVQITKFISVCSTQASHKDAYHGKLLKSQIVRI